MQLLTYETMSDNIGLTDAKDCETCSLLKDVPLRNYLTYMDVPSAKFHIGGRVSTQLVT